MQYSVSVPDELIVPSPIPDEAVLVFEDPSGRTVLVAADLHIGYEAELRLSGIIIPSQTDEKLERLMKLAGKASAARVVLLGDVKHRVPGISRQEKFEIPRFLHELATSVEKLDIVLGNHDGGLKNMVPRQVETHNNLVIGEIGLTHGHRWPSKGVMNCGTVVIGHNHPTFMFEDELMQRNFEPCWLRAPLLPGKLKKKYDRVARGATVIVAPAFGEMRRGTPVNIAGSKFLGPLMNSGAVTVNRAGVYLLDGTHLGILSDLKNKQSMRRRGKRS
jgi:putative SbcD/Mre11-related phosphoesterase